MNNNNRPHGMSLLDYLWTHFGTYEVSNEASLVPSDHVILTEQALANFFLEATEGGITSLTYRKHPTKEGVMQLIGTSINGSELTVVEMPEEVHVQSFLRRKITLEDIDNGAEYPIDSDILSIVLTNGLEFIVSMMDLDLMISSRDTTTIHTEITNGVISSELKIDTRNNDISLVPIHNSGNGIYADIKVSDTDSGVKIEKESDGLLAYIPINGSKLRFQTLKLDLYLVLEPKDPTTLYFITDTPYIYFGGVRYGSGLETSDSPIVSIAYDDDHMLLSYKKVGEDITLIHLGPADENLPGMMSTESYVDLLNLKNKLGEIDSIPEYIDTQVGLLAYSIELGEKHNNTRPLILKAKNGGILSTVDLDVENFLQEAENKIADAQDVIDSGETVTEGHQILILTLVSGDKIYVDLNALVSSFTTSNTDTVELNLSESNNFTANVRIDGNDKILHASSKGIQTYWLVVQADNTVVFYGKNQTLEYKLGQITVPDTLLDYKFKDSITAEEVIQFPPRSVDGIDYDYDTNPVTVGDPYIILGYGANDKLSYDYISIKPLYQAILLSKQDNNTLTKGDDGFLYNEDRSILRGELKEGILTLYLGNDTNIIIPIPEATSELSGLLSSLDKAKLEVILGDGEGNIYTMLEDLERLKSDVNNIGNVIIPEMNANTAKALDGKVDWDETKTVITLPKNGAISALRNDETLEGGNLLALRTYDEGKTYVSEVGTIKNKLTLNASERPQIDLQGGLSEKVAYLSEVELVPMEINIPIRTLKDLVYDKETILGWFGVTDDSDLKKKIAYKGIQYIKYGILLSTNPHYYKMPVEYIAYESTNLIKLVFNGLDTSNDVPSKYEIIINTDGTIIEGNSNVKLTITPLATLAEEIQDQILSNIVQELGQDTSKVISLKVVTDNINLLNTNLSSLSSKVGNEKTDQAEATGIYKIIADNKTSIDAAIAEMIPLSQKGSINGVATLSENGKVPASQLPIYLDDVLEGTLVSTTEFTLNEGQQGEVKQSGVLYVDTTTNKTYRWSGSQYVMSGSDLALGETSSTAYAGDKGKQVTDRVAEVYGANSTINGLSDITFDSDDTEAQILSADNAIKTWDGSSTSHDMKIPYATTTKAGVMSAADKSKLDLLTEGLSDDTPSMSEVVENINTITENITNIQEDITNIENSIGDTSNLTTEATTIVDAINEHETLIDTISNDVFNLKNDTVKSVQVGTNEAITPVDGLITIPNVTTEADGAMSKEDKTKLDIIIDSGDGTKYLSNDGAYKDITNALLLNSTNLTYDGDTGNYTSTTEETYNKIIETLGLGKPVYIWLLHGYYPALIRVDLENGMYLYTLAHNTLTDHGYIQISLLRLFISKTDYSITNSYNTIEFETKGDGTLFLSNDGTYKTVTMNLSEDYAASTEVNEALEPAAKDSYETAIGKLHKAILDNEEVTTQALVNFQTVLGTINPNLTLPDLSGTNYLQSASTFVACLQALDTTLKTVADQAATISDLESRIAALEDALTLKTS